MCDAVSAAYYAARNNDDDAVAADADVDTVAA